MASLLFFSKDWRGLALPIRLITGSKFQHVAIEIDGTVWDSSRLGHRRISREELEDSIAIEVSILMDEARAIKALDSRLTHRYGYRSCILTALYLLIHKECKYPGKIGHSHCAHYTALGLVCGGVPVHKPLGGLTPADLARDFGIEEPCKDIKQRLRRAFFGRD